MLQQIIIDSLLFLKKEGSIVVNAFVIMPNHLHLIWQIQDGYNRPINYPWNLGQYPEEYKYSSAKFYETGMDEFGLLTHYRD